MNEDNPTSALADKKPPRESAKALAAYSAYESYGDDRSLEKLATWYQERTESVPESERKKKPFAPTISTLKRWSSDYGWQHRLALHAQAELDARRKKRQAALDLMDEQQAEDGYAYRIQAATRIQELIDTNRFGALAAVALLKIGYEMERIARGAATARLEASGPDGGPLVVSGQVGFYPVLLPQKDPPPDTQIGQSDEP